MDIINHIYKKGWKRIDVSFPNSEEINLKLIDIEPERMLQVSFNEQSVEIITEDEEQILCEANQILMAPFGRDGIEVLHNDDLKFSILIKKSQTCIAP
jgi:hypothetical protein